MIVDGQLHGGIAQGVGQALWEGAIYSDDGQLLTGSMLDYALPRAAWFPNIELDETVTPSPVNPLGVKGVGEAGAIASTAAVANAVVDALSPLGIRHLDMPYTAPDRVASHPVREGRPGMIPAAFGYQRPATLDEALAALAASNGSAKVHRRRDEPAAADEAAAGQPGDAHRHRPARGAQGRQGRCPTAASRSGRSRPTRRCSRRRRSTSPRTASSGIGDVQVRNRGHGRRRHRPRRSGVGRSRRSALALDYSRRPALGARRAGRAARRVLRGRVPDRDRARRDPRLDAPRAAARRCERRVPQARAAGLRLLDRRAWPPWSPRAAGRSRTPGSR